MLCVCVLIHLTTAHSSVDDHLVRWFGLNQSKYQWALDEYYESKESVSFFLSLYMFPLSLYMFSFLFLRVLYRSLY